MFDPICFCCFVVLFKFFFVRFALFVLLGSCELVDDCERNRSGGRMAELKEERSE